jgi:hypothetical protein
MKFRTMFRLLLTLVCSTTLTWAAQETAASEGDGGCREIAGQLPHTTSTFGHGPVTAPRNAIRPRNLKWELPSAAATGCEWNLLGNALGTLSVSGLRCRSMGVTGVAP